MDVDALECGRERSKSFVSLTQRVTWCGAATCLKLGIKFRRDACASLHRARGRETRCHHCLKLENAFAEREHAAIRSKGYFRVASRDASLRVLDHRDVAAKFPDRMLGQLSGHKMRLVLTRHLHGGDEKRPGLLRHRDALVLDEVAVLETAGVPKRCEAEAHVLLGVMQSRQRLGRRTLQCLAGQIQPVDAEMNMSIDESGRHGAVAQIKDVCAVGTADRI